MISYRNIRLGILPGPEFKAALGMETLILALKGIMFYMSYAPEGFTDRTIDIFVKSARQGNPPVVSLATAGD